MAVFPRGMAARPAATPPQASPATSHPVTLLPGSTDNASSPEGAPEAGDTASRPALTAAQTDKLIEDVLARHTQSFEALDAFEDLSHGLLLAREERQEVPCLGPGADAWTSDDTTDQELAADLCLLCPVFALCQRYADEADPGAGTWAGVTRNRDRRISPEWAARKARGTTGRGADRARRRAANAGRRWNPGQRDCTCGCGGVTKGGWYLSGHDSRHLASLRRSIRSGSITLDAALAEVGHSERLQAKLRH